MKKTLLTSLLAIITIFGLCAQEKYDAKLNLPAHIKVPLRNTVNMKQNISVPGQGAQQGETTITSELVFTVEEIVNGNYRIHCIINNIAMDVKVNGKETLKGSSKEIPESCPEQMKETFKMAGKVVEAVVTPKFQLVGDVKPITEGVTENEAKAIFAHFAEVGTLYPSKPLAINETETTEVKESDMPYTLTYKLANVSDHSLTLQNTIKVDANIQGIPMKGDGSVNTDLDRATGVPVFSLTTLSVSGVMNTPQGIISLSMQTTSTIEFMQ